MPAEIEKLVHGGGCIYRCVTSAVFFELVLHQQDLPQSFWHKSGRGPNKGITSTYWEPTKETGFLLDQCEMLSRSRIHCREGQMRQKSLVCKVGKGTELNRGPCTINCLNAQSCTQNLWSSQRAGLPEHLSGPQLRLLRSG